MFSITSLFCALSDSLLTLTIARVLQGFGAAIMSVNTALIRIIYPQRFLGRGMGINSLIVACSSAAGPTVAAAILSVASAMAVRHQPADRPRRAAAGHEVPTGQRPKSDNRRFDPTSAVLNALTFGLLITAISGFARGQSLTLIFSEIAALLTIGAVFVRRQLRREFPLLPVDLLRIPIFALSMGTSICSFAAQMLAMVSLPFFLQSALGRDEVATGCC